MAFQRPNPVSEWSDKELEQYTFGPFAAAQTGTLLYQKLPIEFPKDTIIHDVRIKVATTSATAGVLSTAASTLFLAKGSVNATTRVVTKPTEGSAIPAGCQVCTGRLLNAVSTGTGGIVLERLEWLPVQKGYATTGTVTFNTQVSPGDPATNTTSGGWDNVIEKGNNLYFTTDVAATALAGLWITIRVGERRHG